MNGVLHPTPHAFDPYHGMSALPMHTVIESDAVTGDALLPAFWLQIR